MASRSVTRTINTHNNAPTLDLFNFDAPGHESSRYILTSPRSLQACSRLKIKPVDLLPKSLQEFSQSLPQLSGRTGTETTLKTVYKEFEKQRRSKLQRAREERERIIAESGGPSLKPTSHEPFVNSQSKDSSIDCLVRVSKGLEDGGPKVVAALKKTASMLKEKDHRILGALEGRFVEEEKNALLSESVRIQWDIQRKREQMDKKQSETKRQRELTQSQRQFKQQLSQLKMLQVALDDEEKLLQLSNIQTKWDRWATSSELQAKACSQKLEEKRFLEEKKKKLQEQRLCELEAEDEVNREVVSEYRRQVGNRVRENRSIRTANDSMERQLKRTAAESRYKQRRVELEEEIKIERESLKRYLDERDTSVQQRYTALKQHREALSRQAGECRTQRALKCKQVVEQIDRQLEEWRIELQSHHQQSMTHADRTTQRLIEEKRQRAHDDRTKREKQHMERLGQVLEEKREKQLGYIEEIGVKNARSEGIARERSSFVEKSRQIAHDSATQRDQLKDKYLRNSFDRMAREAELLASLERKHSRNCTQSKTILG